ncbi:lysozyme inhibitor LprI family protein [Neobacillus rhizosphaerae]|uniref:lysozyme inhibitor LprI family protein n=1 Tax=Neobacillus rhizosphaerae TaxID=2880965 RepID=UPI003D2D59F7
MKSNRKLLMVLLTIILVVLAACGKSSVESNAKLNNQPKVQEDTSNHTSTNSNDGESQKPSNNEMTESKKDQYLKKLNDMEEADRNEEAKSTMVEMEEQEADRYKRWDEALNEIYGVLKEQLDTEQMDKLKEEQRKWIKHRDEAAKEASLKYKGGTTEALEYVATQATLTRGRCYELVAKYMK